MKIDFHCHVFKESNSYKALNAQFKQFHGYGFFERILRSIEKIDTIKTNNVIEKTIFHAKKAGFDKVVLLPLSASENRLVNDWVKFAPELFVPFFNPPEDEGREIDVKNAIEREIVENKYKGLKIMLPFRKKHLNDKISYPALEIAQDRQIVVLMHAGWPPPGTRKSVLTYSNPINIDEILCSFPKVNFVIAHMGFPFSDIAITLAVQYPNVYLDVSNLTYMMPYRLKELLLQAKDVIGTDKILFGSDGFVPEMIETTIKYFDNVDFLTGEEVEKILGLNAAKLLNLK